LDNRKKSTGKHKVLSLLYVHSIHIKVCREESLDFCMYGEAGKELSPVNKTKTLTHRHKTTRGWLIRNLEVIQGTNEEIAQEGSKQTQGKVLAC
jgi:hypothetical protein